MMNEKHVVGFVKRRDGYWWIVSDEPVSNVSPVKGGEFQSTGDAHGARVLRDIKSKWLEKHTPDVAMNIKWITLFLKRRAAEALYAIARKLTEGE